LAPAAEKEPIENGQFSKIKMGSNKIRGPYFLAIFYGIQKLGSQQRKNRSLKVKPLLPILLVLLLCPLKYSMKERHNFIWQISRGEETFLKGNLNFQKIYLAIFKLSKMGEKIFYLSIIHILQNWID
jgi:hypothetical protein